MPPSASVGTAQINIISIIKMEIGAVAMTMTLGVLRILSFGECECTKLHTMLVYRISHLKPYFIFTCPG